MDFEKARGTVLESTHLEGLMREEKGLLVMLANPQVFEPGELVFRKGERYDGRFLLIIEGGVDVVEEKSGRVLVSRGGGELVGEIGHHNPDAVRTATVKAADTYGMQALWWDMDLVRRLEPELYASLVRRFEEIGFGRLAEDGMMG